MIDAFQENKTGYFPKRWKARFGSNKNQKTPLHHHWKIFEEKGNRFLRAHSNGSAVTIGKKKSIRPQKGLHINWKWRLIKNPKKGDETKKKSNDSGAALYVLFEGFIIPYSIKYVWSSSLPKDTVITSPTCKRCKIIVIRNQDSPHGRWFQEKRNIIIDYEKAFKTGKPQKKIIGIALLSDSDDTHSQSMADYDNIFFSIY